MLINEVENIVGLSKKSIRYYEKNGLLRPSRNDTNDYRIYKEEDIATLKKIKFLRDLGVPIRDLKMLTRKELSLVECMQDRIKKIENEEENYRTIKEICENIARDGKSYDSLEFESHSLRVNVLRKEGFTMRDLRQSKTRKIVGAVVASSLFSIFFIFLIAMISCFQFAEGGTIPWLIYGILVLILGLPVVGIVYNLISRIKEILGGEEDEASKY